VYGIKAIYINVYRSSYKVFAILTVRGQNWIVYENRVNLKYKISRKSDLRKLRFSMRTDGRTDGNTRRG